MSEPSPHDHAHEHAPPSEVDLLRWSEALSAIAKTGLGFSDNLYERERFEEVLAVAADIRVASGQAFDTDTVVVEWMKQVNPGVPGYVTPKVAVGAVVGDDEGRILLIKRADSGIWLYPTGWCDVGYSASEVVLKEVWEETGIEAEVIAPIAIFDGLRLGFTGIPLYSIVFACRPTGGELRPHPLECADAGWFARDELPEPMAGADLWIDHAFRAIAGEQVPVWFDPPRRRPWREHEEQEDDHG